VIKLVTIHIPKLYFIGIDESNHGRFPEIYVSALSTDEKDVVPNQKLPKFRNKKKLEEITQNIEDYRYVKITRDISNFYGKFAIKSHAIVNLLIGFDLNPSNIFVYVDGNSTQEMFEDIISLFNSNQDKGDLPEKNLQFMVHGDQIYPIINKTDRMAYKIFKEIERNSNYEIKESYVEIPLRC
tara:strand:- start:178 stop:726 length:549 start_codon:yes stop_codon:yes gene_type:complete